MIIIFCASPLGRNCTVMYCPIYAFTVCCTLTGILILCNIFVELEHFMLFNNLYQLHLSQDKHKINGSIGSSMCPILQKYSILSIECWKCPHFFFFLQAHTRTTVINWSLNMLPEDSLLFLYFCSGQWGINDIYVLWKNV